jgi:hypothetical protein
VTFLSIYTEVANLRFNASSAMVAQIKNWVNAREGEAWQYADWPIKESTQFNLTVVGGTATVALPTGMLQTSQGIDIYDDYGNSLDYLEPAEFYATYGAAPSSPLPNSAPEAWTLVTDPASPGALSFRLGPTPSASKTFTIQGWNLPVKRTATSTWAIGTMSADTDLPWWPDPYHYFLVSGAIALGKRLQSDPSWQSDEQDFQSGLERLRKELLPAGRREVLQWGASSYGA